ncbi:hypothetical protein N7527_011198 [Penicillium freii]|nr:hypothetical protein N7527_011198 [Penicillium freii]
MQEIPRTSLDTLQESEEPFLKDPEALQQYNLGNSTYFPWAVPWMFCLLLLIGNAIQARESGLFGPPPKYYWSARELATDIFLTKQEVDEIIKSGGTFANLPQNDDLYSDPFTGLYKAV